MKRVFEIIGAFIVALLLIGIPILLTLSFAYNWFASLKFILICACLIEWFGITSLLFVLSQVTE